MRFIKNKLWSKIFFLTGIPLLISVIFIAVFFISSLSTEIKKMKNDAIFSQVQARSNQIANWLNGYRLYLKALSAQIESLPTDKISQIIKNHDFKDINVEYIFYIDENKYAHYTNKSSPIAYDLNKYKKIREHNSSYFLAAATKSKFSDNMIISVFYKLKNNNYLGMALKLKVLQDIITSMKFGDGSFAFLTDDAGIMTAIELEKLIFKLNVHKGDETLGYTGMNKIAENFYANYQPTTGVYIRPKTNEALRSFMIPVAATNGWSMGFVYPVENYLQEIKSINYQFVVLMFALVIILMLILAMVLYSSFKPIKQMIKIFNNLASKEDNSADLSARVELINTDEIGELGKKFNDFMYFISTLVEAIKEKYNRLQTNISDSNTNLTNTLSHLEEQIDEISYMARTMDEFSAAVNDIAVHSNESALITTKGKKQIEQNSERIREVLNFIKNNNSFTKEVPDKITQAHLAINTSLTIIDNLEDLNIQIASATEQQNQNANEINQNLAKILNFSGLVVENTKEITILQTKIRKATDELDKLIARFKLI